MTREFILDDFMGGFLYTLYYQKWEKFGWYLHLLLRSIDAALIVMLGYVGTPLPPSPILPVPRPPS